MCAGSYGARSDNDLVAMVKEFGSRIQFVHLRNIKREADGSFYESEHLSGDNDIVGLVGALLSQERERADNGVALSQIPMRPDHGHAMGDEKNDPNVRPGYSYAGRMKGLAELRGVIHTISALQPRWPHAAPDRLLPTDDHQRSIARALYESVKELPIISPHGHTDPEWFATDAPFTDPVSLFITPDHYVFRMLYSQGVPLEALGIGKPALSDEEARTVWRLFATNYHLFRGTPSRIWLDHVFSEVFDIEQRLSSDTADTYFDAISAALKTDAFKPRALFDRFNIEVLATTESPLDTLPFHDQIAASEWDGRVITTFRPDPVMDPEFEGFVDNVEQLGELTNFDISSYAGYLNALRDRRGYFRARGATATDHGHPSPRTADLSGTESAALYQKVLSGSASSEDANLFRAQMLTRK